MSIPESPPNFEDIFMANFGNRQKELLKIVSSTLVDGKYLHWDKIKRKKPLPSGIKTPEEWWGALKFHRILPRKFITLDNTADHRFSFSIEDPIYEKHLFIDQHLGGTIEMPAGIGETEMKRQFYVNSLIEEAITSSQLEGASTTRRVAKAMILNKRMPRDKSQRMIMNNYRTMEFIDTIKNRPLSKELIFEIHRLISTDTLDEEDQVGRYRNNEENDIAVRDILTGEVLHQPPPAEQLDELMSTLCNIANEKTPEYFIHPVIRSIVLHFLIGYIHPFVDGNGRTARAIFYWSMLHHGYWLAQYISISRILKKEQGRYSNSYLHTETDDNDMNYFLLYHLDVIERAISSLHDFVKRKEAELVQVARELEHLDQFNYRQRELLRRAVQKPELDYTFKSHQTSHGIAYASARSDILKLVEEGLLRQYKVGRAMHFMPVDDIKQRLKKKP